MSCSGDVKQVFRNPPLSSIMASMEEYFLVENQKLNGTKMMLSWRYLMI